MQKKSFILIVMMLMGTILYLSSTPTLAQEGYYGYEEDTKAWVWIPGVWQPTYRERKTMRSVTICVKGLPVEASTNLYVDGKPVGSIQDSGCRKFVVSKAEGHTFCVDEEVSGASLTYEGVTVSTRYLCPGKCWSVEPIKKERVCEYIPVCEWVYPDVCPLCLDPSAPTCIPCPREYVCYQFYRCRYVEEEVGEQSYTFEYYAEHQIAIINPHGENINEWVKDGSTINFYAEEVIQLRDESRVKERDVFKSWSVNGQPNVNNAISLTVTNPTVAKASYESELEYRIKVDSEYGHPGMDNANGWYMKGEDATISVESEIPMDGWKGAWGGKHVFVAWYSEEGLESRNPAYTFMVEDAKNFRAEWKIDDSKPMMYLYILIGVIIAAAAAILTYALYRARRIQRVPEGEEGGEWEERHVHPHMPEERKKGRRRRKPRSQGDIEV